MESYSTDVQEALHTGKLIGQKSLLRKIVILAILSSLTAWSISAIELNINSQGLQSAVNIMKYFIWPDINSAPGDSTIMKHFLAWNPNSVPYLMYQTIMIAFLGTILGAMMSIPVAFLASKNITGRYLSSIGIVLITLIRTLPVFIWALFFVTVQGGAFAGVLAISVTSIGMISKLFIEAIEDIDKGILEALDSTGATTIQKIRFGIIPQLTASFLSTTIYRFEINVKNATILGMVGAGGIGMKLMGALSDGFNDIVAVCLWGIIPVVFVIEFFSTRIRTKLTTGE